MLKIIFYFLLSGQEESIKFSKKNLNPVIGGFSSLWSQKIRILVFSKFLPMSG